MSLGTTNRDGGKTSESGHLRAIYKGIAGEVLVGLAVSQRGAGANMSVDTAVGDAIIPRSDATYGHPSFNDAVLNTAITTADPSNPRNDILIMYIDYNEAPSTAVSNNTNGVVKVAVVAGTPAGSPTDPSEASLQSAAGSGNPYIKLARIRVAAGATSIANSVIDDLRQLAQANNSLNIGWKPLSTTWDAWTYSAWDNTNKLATVTVADSSIFTLGQKVKYWQLTGGWKYGFVVKLTNATTIVIYQGTDYTLNNERIYIPSVSSSKAPSGFPLDPEKWSVITTLSADRSVNSTSLTSMTDTLGLPIGAWRVRAAYHAFLQTGATTRYGLITISSDGSTQNLPKLSASVRVASNISTGWGSSLFVEDIVVVTSNTTLTLMGVTNNADATIKISASLMGINGFIEATIAYL